VFSEYVRQYFISRITPHWSEIRDWSYRIEGLENKLVEIERIANEPIAYCAYPGFEKDDALSRLKRIREALRRGYSN